MERPWFGPMTGNDYKTMIWPIPFILYGMWSFGKLTKLFAYNFCLKCFRVLLVPKGMNRLDRTTSPDGFSAHIIIVLLWCLRDPYYSDWFWNKCLYGFDGVKMKIFIDIFGDIIGPMGVLKRVEPHIFIIYSPKYTI